jgi:hypothetical protein
MIKTVICNKQQTNRNIGLFHEASIQKSHSSYLPTLEDGTDSVLKRWHIKFRRWGMTQKKAYSIQNMAKVSNQG